MSKAASALCASLLLAGCAGAPTIGAPASSPAPTASESRAGERPDWRQVATDRDAERLTGWRPLLDQARQRILAGENRDKLLAGEGLYEVDSAVGYEAPPAGLYRCNMTKLAGKYLDMIAYDYFQCRVIVEDGRRQFVKLTGSQRQVGYIYDAAPDHAGDDRHGVFLGTLLLGDEDRLVPYGSREDRDEAAIVQKLAQKRWRMIFPKPFYEADINIIDLQLIE
ncbi:MAG: DUF4893 domain-containing protein [Parasphingorhabdus sp.]|nr:DUF4893 domain-containing protein [Parasphingorhabdus sp.]